MKNLEKEVLKFLKERKWDKLRPSDIAKSISIEAAEILEIFQWDSPSLAEARKDRQRITKIKKELADIFIYAIEMVVLLGLDANEIIKEKLKLLKEKYPAQLMRTRKTGKSHYWQRKEEWRRMGIN